MCKDCFNNCAEKISDKCIETNLPDDEQLDICEGDPLYDVEVALVKAIKSALDGTGISINSVSLENCAHLKAQFAGKDKSISNLFQLLVDNFCALKTLVEQLKPKAFTFNTGCLTVPTNAGPNEILQSVLLAYCSLQAVVNGFPSDYVRITDLPALVTALIKNYQEAPKPATTVQTSYKDMMIPMVAYEYYGSLANFSSNGSGLASKGFDKVYICNGSNGTPDRRGRTAVGATRNVPGGAMDAAVDPTIPQNSSANYSVGDKFGQNSVSLSKNQIPGFSFTIPGSTITINIPGQKGGDNSDHSNTAAFAYGDKTAGETGFNSTKTFNSSIPSQNITISGGTLAHENRQPSIAANFIMYVP